MAGSAEVLDIVLTGLDVSKLAIGTASGVITLGTSAPSGVGTSRISKWLPVRVEGVDYYIPMWT